MIDHITISVSDVNLSRSHCRQRSFIFNERYVYSRTVDLHYSDTRA